MAEDTKVAKKKCMDGLPVLITFLVGAAIGVGIVLFAEAKTKQEEGKDYGDADLFV
jgi:hypothetical protein